MDRQQVVAAVVGGSRNGFSALELVVDQETAVGEAQGSRIAEGSIVETSGSWTGHLHIAAEASSRIWRHLRGQCHFHRRWEGASFRDRQPALAQRGQQGCMPLARPVVLEAEM